MENATISTAEISNEETPGFLLTKSTAKILHTRVDPEILEPCLKEAKMLRNAGRFSLSKGYDESGRLVETTREQRGAHQCVSGKQVSFLTSWIFPLVEKYAQENLFSEGKRIFKSQDMYMWYETGLGLGLHADDTTNGSKDYHRVITVLIYLNSDFEGGEIIFPQHNFQIKPEKGDVVVFPSNKLFKHQIQPIISGERYSIMQTWNVMDNPKWDTSKAVSSNPLSPIMLK